MSEEGRLIKNTAIIAIGSISTKVITFFMLPFYTAYLSTSEYGIYDYIFQISLFIFPMVTFLMDESVFRFLIDCKYEYEKKIVITNAVVIEIVGVLIFVLVGYYIGQCLKIAYLNYAIAYIVSCVTSIILNPIMRGQGNYVLFTIFNSLISLFLTILSIVFLIFFDMGVEGLLLANIMSHFIIFGLFSIKINLWKYLDFKLVNLEKLAEMLKYSLPLIPNKLAWVFISIVNRVIIMEFLGASMSGVFAVSSKFPLLVSTLYGFFGISWQETASRVINSENASSFYNMIYKKMNMLLVAVVLGSIAFLPVLFYVFVDEKFYKAIEFVPIMVLATYFNCLATFLGGILTAYKDTKSIGISILYSTIINIVLGLILINSFGLNSVLIAMLVSSMFLFKERLKSSSKYIKIDVDKSTLLYDLLLFTIVYLLFSQNKLHYNILNIVITCTYGVYVLYVTDVLAKVINKMHRFIA